MSPNSFRKDSGNPKPRPKTPERVTSAVEIIPESDLLRNITELLKLPLKHQPSSRRSTQTFHPPKKLQTENAPYYRNGYAATPAHHIQRRSEGNIVPPLSPIDALASVAAQQTSAVFPSPRQPSHQSQLSPTTTTWPPFQWDASRQPAGYPPYQDERPSKRARSELLPSPQQPSPQIPQNSARPATSYNAPYGWGRNVEQSINNRQRIHSVGSAQQYQHQGTASRRDDPNRLSDAELLLDFSRNASSSLVNGHPHRKSSTGSNATLLSPTSTLAPRPYGPPSVANGAAPLHTSDRTFGPMLSKANTRDLQTQHSPVSQAVVPAITAPPPPLPDTSHTPSQIEPRQDIQRLAQTMIEKSERIARNLKSKTNEEMPSSALKRQQEQDTKRSGDIGYKQLPLLQGIDAESKSHDGQSVQPQTLLSDIQAYLQQTKEVAAEPTEAFKQPSSMSPTANVQEDVDMVEQPFSVPPHTKVKEGALEMSKNPELEQVNPIDEGTKCAGCDVSPNSFSGEFVDWLQCNGCKQWFHLACAGFTTKEVKKVDKFYCASCQPKFGKTTFVRKSTRAHTSVDYAGLNEGVWRTSDETVEHHYIKPIKEGSMKFLPESFPRMAPEEVTAEYFEKCGHMCEPIVIPGYLNPRPDFPSIVTETGGQSDTTAPLSADDGEDSPYTQEMVQHDGQDMLDMVIPRGLTVRRVTELHGAHMPIEVIDVKSQEGDSSKKWTVGKWAEYYESTGEKVIRNVISLEFSKSLLGRLVRRPKVVRDLDLQDAVWPDSDERRTSVGFYCLMSVADSYTDFHIDFAGSSVYYHVIKGKKTFFFIPPTSKNLKKYEEWCCNKAMNSIWLPDLTKECYRVDLSPGDTMLIPSGWIHSVWTPEDSLVIGGNFLTRLHYSMQLRVVEIERACKVPTKYRYPFFQKVMWYVMIKYLEDDPLPDSVRQQFYTGNKFYRLRQPYLDMDKYGPGSDPGEENYQARYYSKQELSGLPDLVSYIFRSLMIHLDRLDGITQETRKAVTRSIPKNKGDPVEIARTFAIWVAWKRGNEDIPTWAHPNGPLEKKEEPAPPLEESPGPDKKVESAKKITAAEMKKWERLAPVKGYQPPVYQPVTPSLSFVDGLSDQSVAVTDSNPATAPKTSILGPKRTACDTCRKRKMRCKHMPDSPPVTRTAIGVVVDRQPSTKMRTMLAPGPNGAGVMVAGVMLSPEHIGRQRDPSVTAVVAPPVEQPEATPNSDGKKGRNKACPDCRRSKRRCIHDENGNIDPVKQNEPVVPRGSASKKRKSTGSDNSEIMEKKIKVDHTDDSAMAGLEHFDPMLLEQDTITDPNDDHAQAPQANAMDLDMPHVNGVSESNDQAEEMVIEPAPEAILQSTESAEADAPVKADEIVVEAVPEPVLQSTEHANLDAPAPSDEAGLYDHIASLLAQRGISMVERLPDLPPPSPKANKPAVEAIETDNSPAAVTNGLPNGTSPISEPSDTAPHDTSRNPSVPVSPTDTSAPLLNGTAVPHDTTATPAPRRHSSRQSRPVDRFTPVKASASTSPTGGAVHPPSSAKKASLVNGEGKSASPGFSATPVRPKAARKTTSPVAGRDGSVNANAKERARSVGVKTQGKVKRESVGKEGEGKKEETEEEASLRLAMEMQAQEFGLRRRSR